MKWKHFGNKLKMNDKKYPSTPKISLLELLDDNFFKLG